MFLPDSDPVPVPLNRCIGRSREIDELRALVAEGQRLITLTGPGGIGKTRLAIELVAHLECPQISFVALGGVVAQQNLLAAIGQSLGLADGEAPSFLKRLRQLCVGPWICLLDGFEHLLDQAPVLTQMLHHLPQLQLIVTSRSTLRLSGEKVYALQPLEVSGAAVELFEERARFIQPDINLPRGPLEQVCQALEGLPLALELAASRLEVLSLEEIQSRLRQKLQLLEAGLQDAPPRHRTIRATIDWSYELLCEEDRQLLRHLAVYPAGLRLSDLPCGDAQLASVSRLVRQNLLRRHELANGVTRLHFMEVIREYALERLRQAGEEEQLQGQFCDAMLHLASQARQQFGGHEQALAYSRLDEEHENLNAALAWLGQQRRDEMARLISDLGWYWESSGHLAEGLRWSRQCLDFTRQRLEPLLVAGTMARHQGDYTSAESYYREALELAR